MSPRWEHFASTCLVTLALGTPGSRLSAQGIPEAIPEAFIRPIGFRSAFAWHFTQQLGSITVRDDSISLRQVRFSMPQPPDGVRHKSPFLAWFLSFLVPGGGQGYNGQWGKAAAFFGGAALGVVIANQETCNSFSFCAGPGFWLLAASSVGSQIDAPISASAINRRASREAFRVPQTITIARIYF